MVYASVVCKCHCLVSAHVYCDPVAVANLLQLSLNHLASDSRNYQIFALEVMPRKSAFDLPLIVVDKLRGFDECFRVLDEQRSSDLNCFLWDIFHCLGFEVEFSHIKGALIEVFSTSEVLLVLLINLFKKFFVLLL